MTNAQLRVLNEVLVSLFGPAGDGAALLPDVLAALGARDVHVSREALVHELEVASSPEYDERPPEERWGHRLIWDPSDESICVL